MAQMVKEPETLSSALQNTVATPVGNKPQPAAAEIAVVVNGVRTIEGSDKREPFSENTNTVLVFATGAVIRLTSAVTAGQLLFLTNEKTKKEVVCQVVKARNERSAGVYVELEFTQASPGFWGMRFPANGNSPSNLETKDSLSNVPPFSSLKSAPETLPVAASAKSAAPVAPTPASSNREELKTNAPAPTLSAKAPVNGTKVPTLSEFLTQGTADAEKASARTIPPSAEQKSENSLSRKTANDNRNVMRQNDSAKSGVEEGKNVSLTELLIPAPAMVNAAPGTSTFDFVAEEVKIPSWLEPLARNSVVSTPTETVATGSEHKSADLESAAKRDVEAQVSENKAAQSKSLEPRSKTTVQGTIPSGLEEASEMVTGSTEKFEAVLSLSQTGPTPNFGSSLSFDQKASDSAVVAKKSRTGLIFGLLAPCALIVIGGAWYWNSSPSKGADSNTLAAAAAGVTTPELSESAATPLPVKNNSSEAAPVSHEVEAAHGQKLNSSAASSVSRPSAIPNNNAKSPAAAEPPANNIAAGAAVELATMEAPKKPSLGNVHLAAPKVSQRSANSDSGVSESDLALSNPPASSGAASGADLLANKSGQPLAPAPVGGNVVPARLITAIAPVYPQMAKIQHVSGDVKIDALIAADGHVSGTKVLSGPALLHQAAMDAVRQWKYQAASLNGQAMPMHLTVTVQFKLK